MAQTISIPLRFVAKVRDFPWEIGHAAVKRTYLGYGGPEVVVELVDTIHAGFQQGFMRKSLPPEIFLQLDGLKDDVAVPRYLQRQAFPVIVGSQSESDDMTSIREIDAWEARQALFQSNADDESALALVRKFGPWDRLFYPRFGWRSEDTKMVTLCDAGGIWHTRNKILEALRGGPTSWFAFDRRGDFYATDQFPVWQRTDSLVVDAVNTSITVDFLRDVTFGFCARKDCGRAFTIERKGKIFCSQYCAHLTSVRSGRAKRKGS